MSENRMAWDGRTKVGKVKRNQGEGGDDGRKGIEMEDRQRRKVGESRTILWLCG